MNRRLGGDLTKLTAQFDAQQQWPGDYMHADRFDITNKKLAKGVESIHPRKERLTRPDNAGEHCQDQIAGSRPKGEALIRRLKTASSALRPVST